MNTILKIKIMLALICLNCTICFKEFCGNPLKSKLLAHTKACEKKKDFIDKYSLTKEIMEEEYENCGSVLAFKDKYPYWDNHTHYYRLFKEFGIKISLKKAHNNIKTKNKRINTNLKRYGVSHNFIKNSQSRKKWEEKLFIEEGITNVFQREIVKEKSLNTLIEKYGKEYWVNAATVRGANVISSLNKKVFEILLEESIDFLIEFKLKYKKSYYSYDIKIDDKIIEINGDYWHGNPLIYKEDDLILKGSSAEIKVKDKWNKDAIKIQYAIDNNYKVLVIWESELNKEFESTKLKIIEYARS